MSAKRYEKRTMSLRLYQLMPQSKHMEKMCVWIWITNYWKLIPIQAVEFYRSHSHQTVMLIAKASFLYQNETQWKYIYAVGTGGSSVRVRVRLSIVLFSFAHVRSAAGWRSQQKTSMSPKRWGNELTNGHKRSYTQKCVVSALNPIVQQSVLAGPHT